jgi:hypothetical protein
MTIAWRGSDIADSTTFSGSGGAGGEVLDLFPRFARKDAELALAASPAAGGLREGDFFVSDMGRHSARRWPHR